MKLIITNHAFERYRDRSFVYRGDFDGYQSKLQKVTKNELCFLEWQGKPAVYFNQSYWRYVRDEPMNEITLITCLGILEYISNDKWTRLDVARNSRTDRKMEKTIRRKGKYNESSSIV